MASKSASRSSSPPKRKVQTRRAQPNLQRAPMGAGPNLTEMQKRLGNSGTQAWLAEQGASQAVQAKLTVGEPDDKYEQEADRIAETVMRMPEPATPDDEETKVQAKPIPNQITPLIRRRPEEVDEENPVFQQMSESESEADEENVIAQRMPSIEHQEGDEEEEIAQAKLETSCSPAIQRQMDEDDEEVQSKPLIQRQPKEEEEKVQAKQFSNTSPDTGIQRVCAECKEEMQRQPEEKEELAQTKPLVKGQSALKETQIQPKGASAQTPQVTPEITANVNALKSGGSSLPQSTRAFFEPRFDTDFSQVRVHTDGRADDTAKSINAKAFTVGDNIAFGKGQYAPESQEGKRLLGHELTHVVQQVGELGASSTRRASESAQRFSFFDERSAREKIDDALESGDSGDVKDINEEEINEASLDERVRLIRILLRQGWVGPSDEYMIEDLWRSFGTSLPTGISEQSIVALFLRSTDRGAELDEMLVVPVLWRAMPLLDRLEFYDEFGREIEQAQIDVIRAASAEERQVAVQVPNRLLAIYEDMSDEEEYEARLLMIPDNPYEAVSALIARADNWFFDTEDPVFNAIFDLSSADRRRIMIAHRDDLEGMLSEDDFKLVEAMASGSEADALVARLKLATEGRIDDPEGIRKVVEEASVLIQEYRRLQAIAGANALSSDDQMRLEELGNLEALLSFERIDSELRETSFLGMLSEAADSSEEFGSFAQSLGADRMELAKQRILMASDFWGVDEKAVKAALIGLRAPPVEFEEGQSQRDRERRQTVANNTLRQELLDDPDIRAVLDRLDRQGPAGSIHVSNIERLAHADRFDELLSDFNDAVNQSNNAEVFRLTLVFARREDWRTRFKAEGRTFASGLSRISGKRREIVDEILRTQRMPIEKILAYTGDVDLLRFALSQLDEAERGRLRIGYLLSREGREGEELTPIQRAALAEFKAFENKVSESQSILIFEDRGGVQDVLDAALGSEPTAEEMLSPEGRFQAASLIYRRQQERLALGRGAVTPFTETDETMVAAAREYAAIWYRVRSEGQLTTFDFAALMALHDRFSHRAKEFTEASETVSDIAGMVAATVAGIVVVVATGGTATPGVIAAAAAAGASARVVTQEMFGADYYDALSSDALRDALLGAVDAALAVVGASLAARGAELLGLGGPVLIRGAARVAGTAAEKGGESLGRKVAAGAVEAAIDGAFSGAISEAIGTLTDAATWRRGVWQGLVRAGQSALRGGLVGLGSGVAIGGAIPVLGRGLGALVGPRPDQLARLGSINPATLALFKGRPGLLRALADNPLAAAILKRCTSPCYPPTATEAQIKAINDFLARASTFSGRSGTFGDTHRAMLREFFYARRSRLGEALGIIDGLGNLNQLEATLRNLASERADALRSASFRRAGEHIPNLPTAPRGGEYTHALGEHGARLAARDMRERAMGLRGRGGRVPNGQWYNDRFMVEASALAGPDNLVETLASGRTIHHINMRYPVGRVFMPDGTIVSDVRRVLVILLPDGRVRNAYPITTPRVPLP